jgi:hypothetical protein
MDELRKNIHVSDYQGEVFPYEPSKVKTLANVYKPEGLLDRLDPEDDFTSAIEIYKAYDTISPLLASLPDLWVYLAHVDLFPYVQKRHSDVLKDDVTEEYIVDHWFKNKVSLFRMAIPSAWWSVYLSIDNNRENPYELTEILFRNQELRTNSFGPLTLIRHKEAMMGVLEFLNEHQELLVDGMNMRAQYIRKLFNFIGGTKRLEFMPKVFFKAELEKRLDIISRKFTREEIQNNNELFNE